MSTTHRSTLTIVVADDNQDAAVALAMLLDRLGFQVVATAYDGATALSCIRAKKPDVAVLDIALPEMDGYEVARLVREEFPTPPRLVAVTGLGANCDRSDAMEAGFDAYFVKPVDSHRLQQLLQGFLPSA
jgi:two-component system CheB/CheR fusion protein